MRLLFSLLSENAAICVLFIIEMNLSVLKTSTCFCVQDVGLALRTLLATVDETLPQLPASTHREVKAHTWLATFKRTHMLCAIVHVSLYAISLMCLVLFY